MGKSPIHAAMEGVIAEIEPRSSKHRSRPQAGLGLPRRNQFIFRSLQVPCEVLGKC
jgi:hypothetical protein